MYKNVKGLEQFINDPSTVNLNFFQRPTLHEFDSSAFHFEKKVS